MIDKKNLKVFYLIKRYIKNFQKAPSKEEIKTSLETDINKKNLEIKTLQSTGAFNSLDTSEKDKAQLLEELEFFNSLDEEGFNDLIEESLNQLEKEKPVKYDSNKINWIDCENYEQAKNKFIESPDKNDSLFFLASSKDMIEGKPQKIGTNLEKIVVLKKIEKIVRGKYENSVLYEYKFMDDRFDPRYDGKETGALALYFNVYQVVSNEGKKFILFSEKKLPNEMCKFEGMLISMSDSAEVSKTLRMKKIQDIFFVKEFESAVKILPKEELVKFTKELNINVEEWHEILDYHPLGTFNRYVKEYENLRSVQILSGKKDGYPLHIITWGSAGTKKTASQENLAFKFNEEPIINEGSQSSLKGLGVSFVSKPASLGFLAGQDRIAPVDEIGKMIEKELNKHENQSGSNVLGELNPILEHKKRVVSSGNDNSTEIEPTAKFPFTANPVKRISTIEGHIGVVDSTFLSRLCNWVQDYEEHEFLMSEESIESPLRECKNTYNTLHLLYTLRGKYIERNDFLTIFDSCYSFVSEIETEKINELVNESIEMAQEPMKSSVWRPRAPHHIFLIVDGLVKQRCLFQDHDPTFKAKPEDYEEARKIISRMVKGWERNFFLTKKPYSDLKPEVKKIK